MIRSVAPARGLFCILVAALFAACAGGPIQRSPSASDSPSESALSPTPSPEAATPVPSTAAPSAPALRTAVEVNPSVQDRSGVPTEISADYWWTGDGDAGQLGTTAQVGLPSGERIVTVAGGLIVAARVPDPGLANPTHLLIRDFATGALLRDIETPIGLPTAAIAGGRVFWGGTILDPAASDGTDGGLWALDPRTGSEPLAVMAGGENVGTVIGGRTRLTVSPSGRTIAAGLIRLDGTVRTDFVEAPTLQVRHRDSGLPFAVTDEIAISDDQGPNDSPTYGYGITARSIDTGAVRWRFPAAADVDQFALYNIVAVGSAFLVKYYWQVGSSVEWRVARIDAKSGKAQVLLRQGDLGPLHVYLDVSSARYLVLGDDVGGYLGDLIQGGDAGISIFDASTGVLTQDAVLIHTPFMCTADGCRHSE